MGRPGFVDTLSPGKLGEAKAYFSRAIELDRNDRVAKGWLDFVRRFLHLSFPESGRNTLLTGPTRRSPVRLPPARILTRTSLRSYRSQNRDVEHVQPLLVVSSFVSFVCSSLCLSVGTRGAITGPFEAAHAPYLPLLQDRAQPAMACGGQNVYLADNNMVCFLVVLPLQPA
jgi:hypothetical protein